jgi:hypothetical protein
MHTRKSGQCGSAFHAQGRTALRSRPSRRPRAAARPFAIKIFQTDSENRRWNAGRGVHGRARSQHRRQQQWFEAAKLTTFAVIGRNGRSGKVCLYLLGEPSATRTLVWSGDRASAAILVTTKSASEKVSPRHVPTIAGDNNSPSIQQPR